jgi:RNA polymerase sigma-70 factor, ECF subfamily
MAARDMTFSDVDRLGLDADETAGSQAMDEDAFRAFYDRTARPLWAYLSRATGSRQAADDLLQECYYRLLRARGPFDGEAHRRHYLFRIAANLVHDGRRRPSRELPLPEDVDSRAGEQGTASALAARTDVARALGTLRPRDRDLLWFAYADGMTHAEIAEAVGVKPASIRLMLFRARARMLALLTRLPSGARR